MTCSHERFLAAKALLTPEQIERIKAKCDWERMTWLGVWEQWPSMFKPEAHDPKRAVWQRSQRADA